MVDEERLAGPGQDGHRDPVTVVRPEREDAKDEEVHSSLEQGIARGRDGIGSG